MKNARPEEEKIIESIRNRFRLKRKKMTLQLKVQQIFLD